MTGILNEPVQGNESVREIPLEPGGLVEILRTSGHLRVQGTDGDRVIVRSRDGQPLGDDLVIEATPGTIRIRDGQAGLRIGPLSVTTGRSRDLDIAVPRTARVQLRTASGDVEATGIAGAPTRWASASGDLRIAAAGGAIQLETMSGDAVLEATGAIDLGARTVSGDLRVRAARIGTSDVGTTSGDVRLEGELAPGGRHVISSVSGDVELVTPSAVRVEVATITGDVRAHGGHRVEGPRGHRTLVAGAGTVGVSIRTTSGDVRLRATGGSRPPDAGGARRPAARPTTEPDPAPSDPATVAEGTSGPVGPRPITDEDTQAWPVPEPAADDRDADRLDILRALERGELDVEAASRRLAHVDAGRPGAGMETS